MYTYTVLSIQLAQFFYSQVRLTNLSNFSHNVILNFLTDLWFCGYVKSVLQLNLTQSITQRFINIFLIILH